MKHGFLCGVAGTKSRSSGFSLEQMKQDNLARKEQPGDFQMALESLKNLKHRVELVVEEIESPRGLGEHAVSYAAELPNKATESANHGVGRIVFVYDESQSAIWGSNMRIIAYGKSPLAAVDRGVEEEPAPWYWALLIQSLKQNGAGYTHEAGTVSVLTSQGMGALADDAPTNQIELRASWSPTDNNFLPHFNAWQDLIAALAGFSLEGESVTSISKRK
jgi:hypothetical protein